MSGVCPFDASRLARTGHLKWNASRIGSSNVQTIKVANVDIDDSEQYLSCPNLWVRCTDGGRLPTKRRGGDYTNCRKRESSEVFGFGDETPQNANKKYACEARTPNVNTFSNTTRHKNH